MNQTFKATILAIVLSLGLAQTVRAVVDAGEYYIVNDLWGKLLTGNSSNEPRLMAYDAANDAKFIFVAEASGVSGYVKLKQKSSGLYLAASANNAWTVQLLSDSGDTDNYLWVLEQRFDTKIVNKKNTGARLGSDFYSGSGSSWTYYWEAEEVPVYYNKVVGAMTWYSVVPSNGNGFEASRNAAKTAVFTNEYGVPSQQDYQVGEPVDVNGIDYHVLSTTPFSGMGGINLSGRTSWLVFDNVRPSKVASTYLSKVTIDGARAVNGQNCRVEIWLRGAVVIPTPSEAPFVATTDNGTFSVGLASGDRFTNLGQNQNKARSFTLKRGYMATLATAANGGDYSRVYVADHGDLTVTLPTALDRRVSSVFVRKWHYVAKSGYCSVKGDLLSAATVCGSSWAWNWDANKSSSADVEYIPIKAHLYWPDDGKFYKSGSTAMMLFNEPEHSEQHTSDKCSCGGTINEWNAYTQTSKFNATGLRIGSPSATDLSWIKKYLEHCDNMKQRCDFSCTHGYWTSEWASNLNKLKGYGRPIWITEWEYGASWTTGSNPNSPNDARAKVFDILELLEYNNYVERYSYYEFDTKGDNGWMREMFWHNTASEGNAYVGEIYSRIKTHFGYNASVQATPNWWAPSFEAPSIEYATLANGKYTLSVKNPYGDFTAALSVQRRSGSDTWETIYTLPDRDAFETTKLKITIPSGATAGDVVRVSITSILTTGSKESGTYQLADYMAMEDLQNMEFDEGTFVSANIRTYSKDRTGNETSGLNDVTGWAISSNGDARAGGQFAWGASYFLGATDYKAPAASSEGTASGGALGINAVWTATSQYVQSVYLEPGAYTLTMPVYNATGGTTAISKNLFGFVIDGGLEYLDTRTTFPVNQWTTLVVSFVLAEPAYGKISLGYKAPNKGYKDMPHLFVDYVRITKQNPPTPDNLQNLKFNEGTFVQTDLTIGNSDEQQAVMGWTLASAGGTYHSAAQFAYGTGLTIGASGSSYPVPSEGSTDDPSGGALGLLSAWQSFVQYVQPVVLPAGTYTIAAPVYNAGGTTAVSKNLIGFVADNGTEHYASTVQFPMGAWTIATAEFTLEKPTAGRLSVGYTSANTISSNMPHLFVDCIQISDGTHVWPRSSLAGDILKDGEIDSKDIAALVRIILGMQDVQDNNVFDLDAADVNGDQQISVADLTILINLLLNAGSN